MLKTLRNKTSGLIAKLILGLVIFGFVVTGFAGFFQGTPSTTVVEAGRTQLGQDDYTLAWRQAEVGLSQRLQRRPTREEAMASGLDGQVLSQLVTEATLDEQGRTLGLGLSPDRVARLIGDDPSFHDAAGNFSRGNFRQLLASVGMTENDFIRNRQQAAVRSQIVDAIARGATAPEALKTAFGIFSGERRTVDYLVLPASLVEPIADPSAEALSKYFDANKARYRAPEYRSVSFVLLTPEALANPQAVTDQQIEADYATGKQRYSTPERRKVQQLLFPDEASAQAAKTEIAGGKTLEQVAAESKRPLADLGFRTRNDIPDRKLSDAAFALPVNQVSDVVAGTFGPVLLEVQAIESEVVKPLDEVRDQIRQELALQTAGEQLNQAQDAFEDARAGGATLEEAARSAGLTVKTLPAVSRSGEAPDGQPKPDLPEAPGLLEGVFTAETGSENPPINLQPSGSLIYDVTRIDPPRDRTLDEVRAKVLADWKSDEAQRLLGQRAEEVKKKLDAGETIDAVATAGNLTKQTAQGITRQTGAEQLGNEGTEKAFAGKEGLTALAVGADGTSRIVLKVATVAPPLDPASSLKPGDSRRLNQLVENDLLQSYVDGLRQTYDAVSFPQAIAQAQANLR